MKLEVTMKEEDTKAAQIAYLLNEGIIMPEWVVASHYPTLGQITFETEEVQDETCDTRNN